MIKRIGMGAAAFGAAALAMAGSAGAAFPEKNITFIIPYGPGGGFDTYVRKIAPVMGKHLGGKINVVPKNVAGAGGRKALNVLYRAKPDGYNIAIFNMPGMLLDKILDKKQSYDIDKFTWLGRIAQSKYVLTVGKKSPYQDVKSLQSAKGLKYAVTSKASGSYVAGKIMAKAMGMDIKFLTGYKGSAKISLSMVRGDTHLSLFNTRSFARWGKDGDIRAVMSFEPKSPFPGVPTARELGQPALEALTIERVVGTTPGVPADVRKKLSDALFAALNDPAIQGWHKKTKRPIDPLKGPETGKLLEDLAKFFTQYKDVLK
ncbi:MAG: tripartite tricarboxylate transporter substrate binding protein [Alphaproteobacteria bacterium]|nr:tripartite tricarboxylate transporter substrate binding protein [Alphaproteobacteria bacterium]